MGPPAAAAEQPSRVLPRSTPGSMSSNATAAGITDPAYGGSIPMMWIPCVVFAHLFAFSFLVSMWKVSHPQMWENIKRALLCRGRQRPSADGQPVPPTAAAIAAATRAQGEGRAGLRAVAANRTNHLAATAACPATARGPS